MPENNGGNHRRNGGQTPPIRNFVAKNQWQRGGVHDKPNKAKRQKAKQQLKKAIRSQSAADFFIPIKLIAYILPPRCQCFTTSDGTEFGV